MGALSLDHVHDVEVDVYEVNQGQPGLEQNKKLL